MSNLLQIDAYKIYLRQEGDIVKLKIDDLNDFQIIFF